MQPTVSSLEKHQTFRFTCSPDVTCFNACCRNLNQALTPYDVLCLKQFLEMSSGDFLNRYTEESTGPGTGLPVVSLRFSDADDLASLFRRCYGLNASDTGTAQDPQAWQEAVGEFQNTFTQFATQWGWVPQAEHQQALEKCAALEKQVEAQQATIHQLRDLLAQKGLGYSELLQHMQGSLKDQSDQFQALMENIRSAFNDKS